MESLKKLQSIEEKMQNIGDTIRREGAVYEAELADRLAKGLMGADAIKHYNDWMQRNGMEHLMVK